MAIVLLLDDSLPHNPIGFNDQDVYIFRSQRLFNSVQAKNKLYFNPMITGMGITEKEISDFSFSIYNSLVKSNPKVGAIVNFSYLRVFFPLFVLIKLVTDVLEKYNADRIVLYGGAKCFYNTSYGGEGEGERFLFRGSWFYNYYVFLHFKSHAIVIWNNRETVAKLKFFSFVTESRYRIKSLIHSIARRLLLKTTSNKAECDVLFLVFLPLQYNHLLSIKEKYYADKKCLFVFLKKDDLCKKVNGVVASELSVIKVIKCLFRCLFLRIKTKDSFYLSMQSCFQTYYYDFLLGFERINAFFNNTTPNQVVTNMTHGLDVFMVDHACKQHGIEHINYQYVMMPPIVYPVMNMADAYYLSSLNVYRLYRTVNPSFHYYFLKMKEFDYTSCLSKDNPFLVTIFTQPDDYTAMYLELIEGLSIIDWQNSVRFVVKLHPRQDKTKEFCTLINKNSCFSMSSSQISTRDLIQESDFVVSMTSSVLFEAVQYGTPGVIYNPNGLFDNTIKKNDTIMPNVNITAQSIDDVVYYCKNIKTTLSKYNTKYHEFLEFARREQYD